MSNTKLVERTVKHKRVSYFVETDGVLPDGSLGEVTLERQAARGDTIELREGEANRLDALGAFYTDAELKAIASRGETVADQAPPEPPSNDVLDLVSMDKDQVKAWLAGDGPGAKPSVPQVMNAVNNAPEASRQEVAQTVLDAENDRDDGDPRTTLVGPLEEFLKDDEED